MKKELQKERNVNETHAGLEDFKDNRQLMKKSVFGLTVVNDAVLQQGLSQVNALFSFTDLSTFYQPRHKLTEETRQRHR